MGSSGERKVATCIDDGQRRLLAGSCAWVMDCALWSGRQHSLGWVLCTAKQSLQKRRFALSSWYCTVCGLAWALRLPASLLGSLPDLSYSLILHPAHLHCPCAVASASASPTSSARNMWTRRRRWCC